jgi:hypothetical protein
MTVYHAEHDVMLHQGHVADVLPTLPAESVNCRLLRKSIGIELNADYCRLAVDRIGQPIFDFGEASA